ncbi:hypothetical protein ACFWUQ_16100 [Streptomyces sp. NPDC058662]|uniref:hypothetical protein n=1 Tax=Streptomyces sp. NPDC058662 TaxID=3346583 RepID=UPI003658E919
MHRPAARHAAAAAVTALLLTACGTHDEAGGADPTAPAAPAPADKGPVCVGEASKDGVRLLRGGGFRLPGGGGAQYVAASADGTTRTAVLREGAVYEDGRPEQTVTPGQQVTFAGRAYTVGQICSYRVVLEPADAGDRAALAKAPASMKSTGGAADDGLCFTTDPAVAAAASKGFPAEGGMLSILANGGAARFPTGLSLTVAAVDPQAGTAHFKGVCAAVMVADYEDVRIGDTVELAGARFEVAELTEQAVRLRRTA